MGKRPLLAMRLIEARRRAGMTETARLHEALEEDGYEVSRSAVGNYESGKRVPPADYLAAVASVTGVNPGWLLTGEGDPVPEVALEREAARSEAEEVERRESLQNLLDSASIYGSLMEDYPGVGHGRMIADWLLPALSRQNFSGMASVAAALRARGEEIPSAKEWLAKHGQDTSLVNQVKAYFGLHIYHPLAQFPVDATKLERWRLRTYTELIGAALTVLAAGEGRTAGDDISWYMDGCPTDTEEDSDA